MSGHRLRNIDLTGRKALVVGAHGGMGRAVGIALAYEGVLCALMGRNPEKLTDTTQACNDAGSSTISIVCDIAQPATIEAAVRQAIDRLGTLDFLINCAGVYETTRGDDGDLQAWDKVLDVNLKATYYLARYALPEINKSSAGAIVKVGSIAPSYSGAGAYITTSRGLDGYGDALFEDVREHGTKVCTIRPGFVNTPMTASDRLDQYRMIQPEDIARTVLFVLSMPGTVCPTEITLRPQRTPYL
jgi:NAD(P)-dependent dehydrogenase (short-subunit alcohol dehydrogenase family)